MKLVLSGYFGFDNLGDEAILQSMIQTLREIDKNVDITVLSNQPQKTVRMYGVQAVNRWNMKEVANVIRHSDSLISGGGSLLQDKTGGRSVFYYCGVIWLAKLLRKPVIIYAQGIGPLAKTVSQTIVKSTLNRCDYITVRDDASKQLLEQIGVKKQVDVVPDPVMAMTAPDLPEKITLQHVESDQYITVAIRDWPNGHGHLTKIAESLSELAKKGNQLVFLPMHGVEDFETAKQVVTMMEIDGVHLHPVIYPYESSIDEKVALVSETKLLVGMRLHALIFAAVCSRPFVALSYDPKIDAFAKLCEQDVSIQIEDDQWTSSDLTEVIETNLAQADENKKIISIYAEKAKAEAKKTMLHVYQQLSK